MSDEVKAERFKDSLQALINRLSMENESNTPDHVLAAFLAQAFEAFNRSVMQRDSWYGLHLRVETPPLALTFENLRDVNTRRCVEGFKHIPDDWSVAEWVNAMTGEAGEATEALLFLLAAAGKSGNIAKKMIRLRDGVAGNKGSDLDIDTLRAKLAREVADVVIYADLVLASQGLSLADAVRDTFNTKSLELQSPERL